MEDMPSTEQMIAEAQDMGGQTPESSQESPPQEQQANARLIAAAPDLLEALRGMLSCCYDEERDDETIKAVEAARTAIAKATRHSIKEKNHAS